MTEVSQQVCNLVHALPGAVAVFDRNMCYVAHNQTWTDSYGLADHLPVIGLCHYDLYPNTPTRWRQAYTRAIEDGISSGSDHDSFLDPNGYLFHLKWNVSPLRDERQRIIGVVIATRVINEEVATLERERFDRQRLQYALEGAQDGLWDWNAATNDVFFSRRWFEMLGYSHDELPQTFTTFVDLIHPDERRQMQDDVAACIEGRSSTLRMQFRMRHKDASYRWILSRGRVVDWDAEGRPRRLVGMHTDITATKELEARLMAASEAANQSSQAKSEFLANMSHEVRTPLNGILGMAGLLGRTALNSEQREYLSKINTSSRALLEIVNDILDISRLEAGRVELEAENFNLAEVIESVSSLLYPLVVEKKLHLHSNHLNQRNVWLVGDAGRLRQILFNLVGNAIKFTDKGSVRIDFQVESSEGGTSLVRCKVTDTGVGISPADQKVLFDRFSQVDGTLTRRHQGTGLGLAITKQLVEMMDGNIGVVSRQGEGSCFYFNVHVARGVPRVADELDDALRNLPDQGPLHILVAEDNPINQLLVQKLLQEEGHTVDVVSNGEEAVHAVQQIFYDIVLMDVQMPVMDGVEAASHIRLLPDELGSVPIIAFTANAMQGQREEYLAAGLDDYVSKPVEPVRLFAAIRRCMSKQDRDVAKEQSESGATSSKLSRRRAHMRAVEKARSKDSTAALAGGYAPDKTLDKTTKKTPENTTGTGGNGVQPLETNANADKAKQHAAKALAAAPASPAKTSIKGAGLKSAEGVLKSMPTTRAQADSAIDALLRELEG